MSNKIKIIGAVSVLALGIGAYVLMGNSNGIAAGTDATTVAVVNGQTITRGEVEDLAKSLPIATQVPLEQLYPVVIEQIVNDALLEQKVEAEGTANDPEVQKRLDTAKDQIVRGLYVERYVEKAVTDKDVKAEYKKIKEKTGDVEEARARHILVETEEKAKALIKQLDGGAEFAKLAKENSTGPTAVNGGDLGYFTKDAMVKEFSDVVFNMKKGKYSASPIKTQFGYHVVYLEDIRDRKMPKFEEVEQAIRGDLSKKAVADLVDDLRKDADITVYTLDGEPLEQGEKKVN